MNRLKHFFTDYIWHFRAAELPKRRAFPLQICRVLFLTGRLFFKNKGTIHASALTYFTLLSIVPVAGLLFGIAKGYGYDQVLRAKLLESMSGQKQVAEWIIQFADKALNNASGGVVAGVGMIFLLWTALNLLTSIEATFNEIWGVKQGRSVLRKVSDYITLLILCPLLLLVVTTSIAFITTRLQSLVASLPFPDVWDSVIVYSAKLLPVLLAWGTFTFFYIFIPNTRVKFCAGLIAGAVTGTFYTLLQIGYIYAQKYLTGYNAIYGSFAAIPFFLLWLQISWTMILLGAQTAFAVQNVNIYERLPDDIEYSLEYRFLCALRIMTELAHAFAEKSGPRTATQLSEELEIPIRMVRGVLFDLYSAGAAVRLTGDSKTEESCQIALPPETLTPLELFRLLSQRGSKGYETPLAKIPREHLETFVKRISEVPENCSLLKLPAVASIRKEQA